MEPFCQGTDDTMNVSMKVKFWFVKNVKPVLVFDLVQRRLNQTSQKLFKNRKMFLEDENFVYHPLI